MSAAATTSWPARLAAPRAAWCGALAAGALAVLASWPAWRDMVRIGWRDEESSHVLLAPLVAAWLVQQRWSQLRSLPIQRTWAGPIIMALGLGALIVGYQQAVQLLWHAGAVMMVLGALISVLGLNLLTRAWPAWLALGFVIPVPGLLRQSVALPMQNWTAGAVHALMQALGFELERAGSVLSIAGVQVAIAEACNGLRMVVTLLLVCYAYAFITPLKPTGRLIILGLSPLVALACNVVRMAPTVWLYGYSTREVADRFHDAAGWVMLGLAWLLLMAVARLLPRGPDDDSSLSDAETGSANAAPPSGCAWTRSAAPPVDRSAGLWRCGALACTLLLCAGAWAHERQQPQPEDADGYHRQVALAVNSLPFRVGSWVGQDVQVPPAAVALLRPNVLLGRRYMDLETGQQVVVLVIHCRDARDLAGHYPPICYPAHGLSLLGQQPGHWRLGAREIAGTVYRFAAAGNSGPGLVVANFMALPDGRIAGDMQPVRRAAEDYRQRLLGACQVQFVQRADVSPLQQQRAIETLLPGLEPALSAIRSVADMTPAHRFAAPASPRQTVER